MLSLAVAMQVRSGAYTSDFAADPDEAPHVVSGLLIRDVAAGHLFENPLRYAENYYVHFPKVAIGHWPPMFHAVEGVWMLVFGRTKTSLFILLALLASVLVGAIVYSVLPDCGMLASVAAAAIFASTQFVQHSVSWVMPDLFLSLLGFGAMLAWGSYLASENRRVAMAAVVLVLASIATNGRGLAVGLAVLLAGSIGARTPVARLRFRWATGVALILILVPGIVGKPFRVTPGIVLANFLHFGISLARQITWPAALLSALGAVVVWRTKDPRSVSILSLLAATWIFHSLLNFPFDDRYVAGALPAAAALLAIGWHFAAKPWIAVVFSVVACAILVWNLAHLERKTDLGYHTLVNGPSDIARASHISLIAGDPMQEGSYVAEMDLADAHLRHIVLRGSKVLASSTWAGNLYRQKFSSAGEVANYLDQFGVTLVIVQNDGPPHVAQLRDAISSLPDKWHESPAEAIVKNARVFERSGRVPGVPQEITFEMLFQ